MAPDAADDEINHMIHHLLRSTWDCDNCCIFENKTRSRATHGSKPENTSPLGLLLSQVNYSSEIGTN